MFSDKGEEIGGTQVEARVQMSYPVSRAGLCGAVQGGARGLQLSRHNTRHYRKTQTQQQTGHKTNTKFLFNLMSNEGCCAANP